MIEKDFDDKSRMILDKMERLFPDMTDKEYQAIIMFCTMFKDEFCEKESD